MTCSRLRSAGVTGKQAGLLSCQRVEAAVDVVGAGGGGEWFFRSGHVCSARPKTVAQPSARGLCTDCIVDAGNGQESAGGCPWSLPGSAVGGGHPSGGRGRAENADPVSEGECVAEASQIAFTDENECVVNLAVRQVDC